ncbi:MAG: DUF4136 domain-containing protein [Planctomycetes bacterium]|nr:DUF4136 domain-containing protein [Planctomycetota bacterium]
MIASHAVRPGLCAGLLVLAGSVTGTGCTGVTTERDPSFDFATVDTFAWRQSPSFVADVRTADDDLVLAELERTVNRRLAGLGKKLVTANPGIVVDARLQVTVEVQRNDPEWALYVAEKYEQAVLVLEFYDPSSRKSLWRAECRDRLRYTAHGIGTTRVKFTPVDEPRMWHIADMVDRLVTQLEP